MTSFLIWFLSLTLLWTLRALRACNPALQAQSVRALSKGAFTVVFWPIRAERTPSHPLASPLTNMGKLSIWLSRLWTPWRMSGTPGNHGEADGTVQMLSTSNFQERANEREQKGPVTFPSTNK